MFLRCCSGAAGVSRRKNLEPEASCNAGPGTCHLSAFTCSCMMNATQGVACRIRGYQIGSRAVTSSSTTSFPVMPAHLRLLPHAGVLSLQWTTTLPRRWGTPGGACRTRSRRGSLPEELPGGPPLTPPPQSAVSADDRTDGPLRCASPRRKSLVSPSRINEVCSLWVCAVPARLPGDPKKSQECNSRASTL